MSCYMPIDIKVILLICLHLCEFSVSQLKKVYELRGKISQSCFSPVTAKVVF